MIILLSFPRSGNHLIRFFIEYLTGMPTLGCVDNLKDHPIFSDYFELDPNILSHVSSDIPICRKAHTAEECTWILQKEKGAKLILITRDPVEAIIAHAERPRQDILGVIYIFRIIKCAIQIKSIFQFYSKFQGEKVILRYENWISNDKMKNRSEINKLSGILNKYIMKEKKESVIEKFNHLKNVSSKPSTRAWKGFRSKSLLKYHQYNVNYFLRYFIIFIVVLFIRYPKLPQEK